MKINKLKLFSLTIMAFSILNIISLFLSVLLVTLIPFFNFISIYTVVLNLSLYFLHDLINEIKFMLEDDN